MNTKAAVIIAVAIVAAVALYIFFSPYQTCVRNTTTTLDPYVVCASALGNRR